MALLYRKNPNYLILQKELETVNYLPKFGIDFEIQELINSKFDTDEIDVNIIDYTLFQANNQLLLIVTVDFKEENENSSI